MALRDLGNGYYACESGEANELVQYATIEVFYANPAADYMVDEQGEPLEPGWYWWACFPGCLPDGEPSGPFVTKQDALNDAEQE